MRKFKDTRTFNFKTTMKANFGIKFKQGEDHTDDGPLYGKLIEEKGLGNVKITR